MNILEKIKKSINHFYNTKNNIIKSPEHAYNIWADNYDDEKDNLILYYDNIILKELISKIQLKDKIIFDYGCGTGRNWSLILNKNPAKVIGCDISKKMLHKLNKKYPNADVYQSKDLMLPFLLNNTCDIIISTLVIAHIIDIEKMFSEWERIIKNKSDIIITDFHPELLAKGGVRTFKNSTEIITIENYYHSLKTIEEILFRFGFKVNNLIEFKIDESVKHFYAKHKALNLYEKFYNTPFIYGIHLSR